jgi:hypothetical protein
LFANEPIVQWTVILFQWAVILFKWAGNLFQWAMGLVHWADGRAQANCGIINENGEYIAFFLAFFVALCYICTKFDFE